VKFSPSESNRFGLRVFRHRADTVDERDLLERIVKEHADVVILRIPAAEAGGIARLDRTGLPILTADTLVYYESGLDEPSGELRNPDLHLVECTTAEVEQIRAMVAATFGGYANHYAANPLLDADGILEGYAEWATGFITSDGNTTAFLASENDRAVAFATASWNAAGTCEGVLYGVLPEAAGRGVYTDLIRLTREHFRHRGFNRMRVSTQIQNLAVQRAWVREGFRPAEALATIHINALLGTSRLPAEEFGFTLAAGRRPAAAVIEALAERLGERTITHHRLTGLSPLRHGAGYQIRLSYPVVRPDGSGRAAVTVTGPDGLAALGYAELTGPTRPH